MRAPRCRLATVRTGGAGQLAPGPHAQYSTHRAASGAPYVYRRTVWFHPRWPRCSTRYLVITPVGDDARHVT
eukprot:scaffold38128_cov45-Phaeocystis_antarctica.AAC.1